MKAENKISGHIFLLSAHADDFCPPPTLQTERYMYSVSFIWARKTNVYLCNRCRAEASPATIPQISGYEEFNLETECAQIYGILLKINPN